MKLFSKPKGPVSIGHVAWTLPVTVVAFVIMLIFGGFALLIALVAFFGLTHSGAPFGIPALLLCGMFFLLHVSVELFMDSFVELREALGYSPVPP
jgi:hypothetical protein